MVVRKLTFFPVVVSLLLSPVLLLADDDHAERLQEAAEVMNQIMNIPASEIPSDLLDRAHCVAVIPDMKKGALVFGAKYGKGYLSCRSKDRAGWSAPATVRIEGGSWGLQIGGSETDVVLLVMNEKGKDRLLSSQFTIGAGASVAAGPVGRTASASTDAWMTAEMLSYSRSRGVFAGISLEGSTLRQDLDENEELYGREITNREIIEQGIPAPAQAQPLLTALMKFSPAERRSGEVAATTPARTKSTSGRQLARTDQDLIRDVQRALNEKGYSAGDADGVMGRKTRDALTRFQKDQGIGATGRIDDKTLEHLGIN
jgi:lipid-binding SYLF domain-containing protein